MLQQWRAEGYTAEDVELWAVARSGDATSIADFAQGSEAACLTGAGAVYDDYSASKDDVVIIDRDGLIRHRFDSAERMLFDADWRATVDGWVRDLMD